MSFTRLASAVSAAIVFGTIAVGSASAMPLGGLKEAAATVDVATPQNVAWVCGPYRCRWRPNYAYWAPRPYWGPRFYGPRYYGFYGPRFYGPRFYGPRYHRFGFYGPRRYWR